MRDEREPLMDEITVKKMISKNGNSLTLNLRRELEMMGLGWKDNVIVTLRRVDDGKPE